MRWLVLVVALMVSVTACDRGPGPDEVTTAFLDHLIADQRAEGWALLAAADQAAMSAEDFTAHRVRADPSPSSTFDSHTSFEVGTWSKTSDRATVTVAITGPDAKAIVGGLVGAIVNTAVSSDGQATAADEERVQRLSSGDLPLTTFERDYSLVREEPGWRIYLDLRTEVAVEAQLREAKRIEREGTRDEALEAYRAVLVLEPDNGMATKKIAALKARGASVPAPTAAPPAP